MKRISAKRTSLIFLLSIFLGHASAQVSYASEPMKKIDTGYGKINNDNLFRAKEDAISEALRGVIEQVMEPMVKPGIILKNMQIVEENIFSNSLAYIHRYEIISSGINVDNLYVVTLNALVNWKEVEEDLDALGLLQYRHGMPSIMVIINESAPGFENYGGTGSIEQSLIAKFRKKEFEIVEFNYVMDASLSDDFNLARSIDSVALKLASELGADIVIIGRSELSMIGDKDPKRGKIVSVRADINLRAVKADNGRVIAEITGSATYPHSKPILGAARSIAKAASKVSDEMAAVIRHRWKTEVNAGRPIFLKVKDVRDFKSLKRFKKSLGDLIDGLVDVNGRSYDGSSAEFELIARSTPEKVGAELNGKNFEDQNIKLEALTINSLTISLSDSN